SFSIAAAFRQSPAIEKLANDRIRVTYLAQLDVDANILDVWSYTPRAEMKLKAPQRAFSYTVDADAAYGYSSLAAMPQADEDLIALSQDLLGNDNWCALLNHRQFAVLDQATGVCQLVLA